MIPNLIGSEWRKPPDGTATLPVYNPATGQVKIPPVASKGVLYLNCGTTLLAIK